MDDRERLEHLLTGQSMRCAQGLPCGSHGPVDEAHKYRALRDYIIKTGQYDPKTGSVTRISEKSPPSR